MKGHDASIENDTGMKVGPLDENVSLKKKMGIMWQLQGSIMQQEEEDRDLTEKEKKVLGAQVKKEK